MPSTNPFSLSGKRALIAGASRGIGLAIAQAVARAGAHAMLAARSREALDQRVAELRGEGFSAEAIPLDITSPESIRTAVDAAGDIDILHNVAGTNVRKAFPAYTQEEYDRVMQTNLHGIVQVTQLVGQKMIARGAGGKIVTIGSLMSLRGLPFLSVYAMTKTALAGLSRVLAAEWGRYNIQVNCIAPGFIITDLNREVWKEQKMLDWLKGVQPNPLPGQPEDIAPLAVLLSGPGSAYITGQTIAIDGGYTTGAVWPFEG